MPNLVFGPLGDQWLYECSTRTYDLAREASKRLTISTTKGPADTSIVVNPDATALVVVDMQNFFLDAKCRSHPTGLAAVDSTLDVIRKCREVGIQVVWLNWGLTDGDLEAMPAGVERGFARSLICPDNQQGGATRSGLGSDLGSGMGRMLVAGEWNSAIYPPLASVAEPEDVHCAKNRMSGLWHTSQPLWRHLEQGGRRTLLFAGVNTDQCVLGTLVDAHNAGWDCVMIDDCCATTTQHGHEVCLSNVSNCYGFVTNSKSLTLGTLA
ncbi:isochorismatase [Xylariales sp. PMI_506]|nr:isochorismatase [Xylariales sp. PMI_506]